MKIKKLAGFLGIAGIIVYILSTVRYASTHFMYTMGTGNTYILALIFILLILFTIFAFLGKKRPMIFCSFFVLALSLISAYGLYGVLIKIALTAKDAAMFAQHLMGVMPGLEQIQYKAMISAALKPFLPTVLLSIFYIIFTLKFFKSDKLKKPQGEK